jgi:arabinan endo-1,5-alpha-L-arabinosidase
LHRRWRAPDISFFNGKYHLYYAVSTLGHNDSVIALATNTTLDPTAPGYRWVDQGKVVRSLPASDFNAIDPDVVQDAAGTPRLVFGSYWSGIQMVQLQWPSGKRSPSPDRLHLADRKLPLNAIEGAAMIGHNGWYYLFTSWDRCCMGLQSTYRIVVGRSRSITGPYVDRTGRSLMDGGGTTVLASMGLSVSGVVRILLKRVARTTELAKLAMKDGVKLLNAAKSLSTGTTENYAAALKENRLLPPVDHEDPAHCMIAGTQPM